MYIVCLLLFTAHILYTVFKNLSTYFCYILIYHLGDPKDPVLLQKLGSSDIVFLLHDASNPSTLESLRTTWLPLVKTAFGSDRTKSAVIIRSKNDLFTGVSDYRLSELESDQKKSIVSTTTSVAMASQDTLESRVVSEDLAVSQEGTGMFLTQDDGDHDHKEECPSTNEMAYSFVGVDITHPDKFSTAELDLGKEYAFISALSM